MKTKMKMKILICTGIYPPDVGGPAKYAKNLAEEFLGRGYKVKVLAYKIEKKLPIGIRHCLYFFRVFFAAFDADLIIALDTFSTGFPAILTAKLLRKKAILRVGGDFLWETYIEKTGNLIKLKDFYERIPKLPFKQKILFFLQKFTIKNYSALAFNSNWQKKIFEKFYNLDISKNYVIENFYGEKVGDFNFKEKNFLWAGRNIKLKNLTLLKESFSVAQKENIEIKLEISKEISQKELMEKVKESYVVVLPSISDISPNLIMDTITCNKPFILTKECGLVDKFKEVGVFIDPFNKDDIKNKILFLADDNNYKEYKKRIASFNFTHSWKEIADEFLSVYKKLCGF